VRLQSLCQLQYVSYDAIWIQRGRCYATSKAIELPSHADDDPTPFVDAT
jgi:hypothetical protein